jgi:hypothetical protein
MERMMAALGTSDESTVRSSESLLRTSGRDRAEWFTLMDAWGAIGRPYREIADWLTLEHGLSKWWAQKLIVEYEQARGVRKAGVRPDGTFSIGVSRSIAAPVERAYAAFLDRDLRERWLPGVELRVRTARPERSARFDWEDGATRIGVTFASTGEDRCDVAVEHERLASRQDADRASTFWKDHLGTLRELLETAGRGAR